MDLPVRPVDPCRTGHSASTGQTARSDWSDRLVPILAVNTSIYFSCTNICVCADSLLSHTEDVQRGSPWDHRQVLQHLVSCYAGPFIGVVPTSVGANLASACGTPSVQVLSSRTIFLRNFHDHRNRFLPGMIDFAIRLMWLQITDVFMVHSLHFCKKLALLAYN